VSRFQLPGYDFHFNFDFEIEYNRVNRSGLAQRSVIWLLLRLIYYTRTCIWELPIVFLIRWNKIPSLPLIKHTSLFLGILQSSFNLILTTAYTQSPFVMFQWEFDSFGSSLDPLPKNIFYEFRWEGILRLPYDFPSILVRRCQIGIAWETRASTCLFIPILYFLHVVHYQVQVRGTLKTTHCLCVFVWRIVGSTDREKATVNWLIESVIEYR